MSAEAQAVCHFCDTRHLFLGREGRQPGDRVRRYCHDCGWVTAQEVAVVYDADQYRLVDPYGPGIKLHARCVDCGAHYYGTVEECHRCGSTRFNWHWTRPDDPV